jgi:hypothetical protein
MHLADGKSRAPQASQLSFEEAPILSLLYLRNVLHYDEIHLAPAVQR